MPTTVRCPDREDSAKTTVYAAESYQKARFIETCGEHSERLEPLEDLADLELERGGMAYQLRDPEATVLGYCPECLVRTRRRAHRLRDASDRDLVKRRIRENWHGVDGFHELFEPVAASVGDGLAHCPYCAAEFEVINQNTGRCICPEHGELTVSITQHDVRQDAEER